MTNFLRALALVFVISAAPLYAQNDASQQLVVQLNEPGKPGSLDVSLINGFIHVVGHSGKDVIIDAASGSGREKQKARSEDAAATGMRRIATSNSFDLTAEVRNNQVRVHTSSHQRPVNLTIRVPQRFSLKIGTINNGNITVENVTGELEVKNVNGAIDLTNVGGSVVASTINGHLKANFREVSAGSPMAFSTLNGAVDVTFPASVKASLKLKSDRGDIYSDFDIDIQKSQPQTTRSGEGGMSRVTIEDWVTGRINGGGPEIMMKSMQGNIYVRKAK